MEAAVQKSHPVPSSDPLMATAGIPHVAAYLSLQSCKQVAGVLPQHFFPLAQVGLEHPTAGSSPGWLCMKPTNFFSQSVCISLQFHLTKCYVNLPDRVE